MNGHKWSHPYPFGFCLVFKKLGIPRGGHLEGKASTFKCRK